MSRKPRSRTDELQDPFTSPSTETTSSSRLPSLKPPNLRMPTVATDSDRVARHLYGSQLHELAALEHGRTCTADDPSPASRPCSFPHSCPSWSDTASALQHNTHLYRYATHRPSPAPPRVRQTVNRMRHTRKSRGAPPIRVAVDDDLSRNG
ncbi:hypothetical protein BD626DRAFT_63685 [Schizophyllum amplum]|uniref:Uncharacterized protein n=1 Tax=Schizophyllum amplum TaxID=97359 RepID=A0A550BSE0_9AGAR|nr:hypothetical protein BD626DRAFT_63685 [Auriculariopsis ampla]